MPKKIIYIFLLVFLSLGIASGVQSQELLATENTTVVAPITKPAAQSSKDTNKPDVILFYSQHCKACLELKKEFIPEIKEKYAGRVNWQELDIQEKEENLTKLMAVSMRLRNNEGLVPAILVGDTLLVGKTEIKEKIVPSIDLAISAKKSFLGIINIDLLQVFKKISIFTVIMSGLIDGVNPCAFAVIVFFISFLAVYGYRRREIIYVGVSYCFAVFITYLLIGLGFFNFLYSLTGFYAAIKIFYYFIAGFCFVLSGLALYDYFRFKKTKETEGLILQLPGFLKKRINETIGSRLRNKKDENAISLCVSAFAVGFLVSLLEAVCTGQVYLPTIVLILKSTNLRLKAFTYLIIYNLMFILPLICVFVLSLLGFSSQKFNDFLKKNLAVIKLLMFVLFFLLGFVLIWLS
jgi:cytochrome c biogenesis protein CcdA